MSRSSRIGLLNLRVVTAVVVLGGGSDNKERRQQPDGQLARRHRGTSKEVCVCIILGRAVRA